MKKCWNFDPEKRPSARDVGDKIEIMCSNEREDNPTKIVKSSDIGLVTTNNPSDL